MEPLLNKHHLYIGQKLRLRQDPEVLSVAANEKVFDAPKTVRKDSKLRADPSNYLVAKGGVIDIQSDETLGHFADWLRLKTSVLRSLNKMSAKKRLVVGKKLKLDFSKVSAQAFEKKRLSYHQAVQDAFQTF